MNLLEVLTTPASLPFQTFQQAKAMQLAILTVGLLAATMPRLSSKSLEMHQVTFEKEAKPDDD